LASLPWKKTIEKQQIACLLSQTPFFVPFKFFFLHQVSKRLLVVSTLLFLKCYQNLTPSENNISPPSPFETLKEGTKD